MTPQPGRREWEEPGAHLVAPGIFRIPLPLPGDALRAVNVYAIVDGANVVMIDSGWALDTSRDLLDASLGRIDRDLASISRFLITHVHRDHYTQAVSIRRALGTRVLLGRGEEQNLLDVIASPDQDRPVALIQRLTNHGATALVDRISGATDIFGPPDDHAWELPDAWMDDGEDIKVGGRRLRAIATPGHTRGHLVFHDAQAGVMFAGDHLLPDITPSIGFESVPSDSSLSDYIASLDAIIMLPDARILPAHGPVAPSTHQRALELTEHHRRRLDDMMRAVESGAHNGFQVAQVVRWTSRGRGFEELDMFNQMIAVNETVAHLEMLHAQGRVARTEIGGTVDYA